MSSPPRRHRFGQHFLSDASVLHDIVMVIAPQMSDHMVEIGPGRGALTEYVVGTVGRLDLIEIDRDLVELLSARYSNNSDISIHNADILQFDWESIGSLEKPLRVVGNLPYNISTPLLFSLFEQLDYINDMIFLLQKEVVERLSAAVGTRQYGRLSVMAQYYCRAEYLLSVPPSAFSPPPKVDSAVVRLVPRSDRPVLNDMAHFSMIVREAFNYRRKTIANALKHVVDPSIWSTIDINPNARPQELSVEDFILLSNNT